MVGDQVYWYIILDANVHLYVTRYTSFDRYTGYQGVLKHSANVA
jgi:hypothetical protein